MHMQCGSHMSIIHKQSVCQQAFLGVVSSVQCQFWSDYEIHFCELLQTLRTYHVSGVLGYETRAVFTSPLLLDPVFAITAGNVMADKRLPACSVIMVLQRRSRG